MEGNRDDSERCLQLASAALAAGNISKATRLLAKSRRMYPLPDQQDRLSNEIRNRTSRDKPSPSASSTPTSTPTRRARQSESQSEPSLPPRQPTQDMLAAVAEIHKVRNKSHYDVLKLPRDCSENDLKKSYRKLALRLHPDRNFAPGADEAFKRVSQAFITLSDPKKRSYYDRTGADEPGQPPQNNLRRRRNPTTFQTASFEDVFGTTEVTPEELFEFMFARHHTAGRTFRRTTQRFPEREREPSSWQRMRPFAFFILFGLLTLLISDRGPSTPFSLRRTPYHTVQKETQNHVTYYLSSTYTHSHESLKHIERRADLQALEQYNMRCVSEREHASFLRQQSRRWLLSATARARYKEKYDNYEQPWCRRTQELQDRMRRYW